MIKALIVDLYNGEGYSSSTAYYKLFDSIEKVHEHCVKEAFDSVGGISSLIDIYDKCDNDTNEDELPGIYIGVNRIMYTDDAHNGSLHYRLMGDDNILGVVLYPNINEYAVVKHGLKWASMIEAVRNNSDDMEDDSDLFGTVHHDLMGNGLDAILLSEDMLYSEEDKLYMLHCTYTLQQQNTHTMYNSKEKLDEAFNTIVEAVKKDNDEIHYESPFEIYYEGSEGTERAYKETYYKF